MTQQQPSSTNNWPLKNIRVAGDHDVVFGRGGASIHHPGCKAFREMVRSHQRQYIGYDNSRHMKTLLTHKLVKKWREQSPPGRFLKKDETTDLWNDVGTKDARRKTAQLLREGAKKVRTEMQAESGASSGSEEEHDSYAAPTTTARVEQQAEQQVGSLVEFAAARGLAPAPTAPTPPSPTISAHPGAPAPAPTTPLAPKESLSADLRAIVRSAPPTVFQYGQPKNSLEMLEMVFEDILDDTNANPQQA